MNIAVPYENGQVFQHFGHSAQFKLYTVENGSILREQVLDTMGSGHGALVGLLAERQVDVLLCGGIGGGAKNALSAVGIRLLAGISGGADEAVQAFLRGELQDNPDALCSHHSHGHDGGHACASHGCGEHSCPGDPGDGE